ncbi:MAG: AAA family ATPase [Firmicutes bacterium]|nr:AAA family ATPase [Bacillota bacterium]
MGDSDIMILTKLRIWNFRKFQHEGDNPGIEVEFHNGINALIGENDSGKTAIIDAIKIVLQTQSNEYIRIVEEDFYCNGNGNFEDEIKIECVFENFTEYEAKNFIEWLQFRKDNNGKIYYVLNIQYRAWKEKNRILNEFRAGMKEDGYRMDGKAKDLLRCTYLRPLRDANKEMHSGRNSRISQILYSHALFNHGEEHKLVEILKEANEEIEKYFTDQEGKELLGALQDNLEEFLDASSSGNAKFVTSNLRLKSILESLSLNISEIQPGLGVQNLLFIAAELLLLNHDDNGGLKLALIEELEAHLHPQAQLRLIEYIQKEYDSSGVQFIISTHSTILASKINVKNALLCKNSRVFSLAPENTKLQKGDYLFLQRFLDSSKANLFFAQGVIMVEGDAENLLLPVIADLIDMPLSKYGISIVNVGNTAFLRYSNIFKQSDNVQMGIPVSVVTDCDVVPEIDKDENIDIKEDETMEVINKKQKKYSEGDIKAFIAPNWTLEYTLALSVLKRKLYKAVLYAEKIQNSDKYSLTKDKIIEVDEKVKVDFERWKDEGYDQYKVAYEIYNNTLLEKNISKAITAQCLSSILQYQIIKTDTENITEEIMFDIDLYQKEIDNEKKLKMRKEILGSKKLSYLLNAIKYAARYQDDN